MITKDNQPRREESEMDKGFVVGPGKGKVWNMAPGRSAALKMLNGQTADSLMLFEEVAPANTETPLHTHADATRSPTF